MLHASRDGKTTATFWPSQALVRVRRGLRLSAGEKGPLSVFACLAEICTPKTTPITSGCPELGMW